MKKHDLTQHLDWAAENKDHENMHTFAGEKGINDLLRKLKISHNLEMVEHQFTDAMGQKASKLTIEIDFSEVEYPVQTHTSFAEEACDKLIDWVGNEINGLIENEEG